MYLSDIRYNVLFLGRWDLPTDFCSNLSIACRALVVYLLMPAKKKSTRSRNSHADSSIPPAASVAAAVTSASDNLSVSLSSNSTRVVTSASMKTKRSAAVAAEAKLAGDSVPDRTSSSAFASTQSPAQPVASQSNTIDSIFSALPLFSSSQSNSSSSSLSSSHSLPSLSVFDSHSHDCSRRSLSRSPR